MKNYHWNDQDEGLLTELMHTYRNGKRIRWNQAFKDHPDWKEQLMHGGRSIAAISAKAGTLASKRSSASNRAQAVASVSESKRGRKRATWTDSQRAAIRGVIEEYSSSGMVDYATALAEHQEWADALASKSKSAIYSMGQKLLEKQKMTAKTKVAIKTKVSEVVDLTDKEHEPKVFFSLNGCPNCLLPLQPLDKAYSGKIEHELPYCPNCTFPLHACRTTLRLANRMANNKHKLNGAV